MDKYYYGQYIENIQFISPSRSGYRQYVLGTTFLHTLFITIYCTVIFLHLCNTILHHICGLYAT